MATVTKPIALDESLHTTETSPRNLADVLDDGLTAIANSYNVTGILPVSNGGTGANNATDAKANIGLGNVPNVTTDNQTPTVTQYSTRTNLATGDTLKTIVGKIKKWFTDLGTAAFKNVPSSGNASTSQVVMGNDTRLSDSRNAADVYSWAKAANKPTYTKSDVGLGNVDNTSDANKPISTATQTALNGKANTSALTDGSVTKIGTSTVGSATQPVYINGGVPTAGKDFANTTGTPTAGTNFSYDGSVSTVAKSGNVVQVRLKFNVSTAFTPTSDTVIATLPFKAFVNFTILSKVLVISGTAYRGTTVIKNTNQLTFDSDARALSVGNSVFIFGTYLTND